MESGWDDDVKNFLLKILNSISWVLLWMLVIATAGIYFQLGYSKGIYTIIFYIIAIVTLLLLIRYLYKVWNKG